MVRAWDRRCFAPDLKIKNMKMIINKHHIAVSSAYVPKKRKTKDVNQWFGYIRAKLKEIRL